jgi:hypothetical protein
MRVSPTAFETPRLAPRTHPRQAETACESCQRGRPRADHLVVPGDTTLSRRLRFPFLRPLGDDLSLASGQVDGLASLVQSAKSPTEQDTPNAIDCQVADEDAHRYANNKKKNERSTAIGLKHIGWTCMSRSRSNGSSRNITMGRRIKDPPRFLLLLRRNKRLFGYLLDSSLLSRRGEPSSDSVQ